MPKFSFHKVPHSENPYAWDFPDGNGTYPSEPFDELGGLSTFLIINYSITSVAGGFLSLLMLYLVMFRTPRAMRKYRKMLLICCVTDLTYWLVDNFMWMKVGEKDGVFIVKMEGLAGLLTRPYRVFTIALYVWIICFLNAILPVQLYFRYYSLLKNNALSTMETLRLVCISLLVAFPTFIYSYISFDRSPEERPGFNYGTLWYREFPLPQLLFGDVRSFYQKGFFYFGGAIIFLSYLLAMIIGYRTLLRMDQMKQSYTEKTIKLQKQLSNFMIVQGVIPLFISVLPIMMIVGPAFFLVDTGRLCFYCVIAISWIPVINPIITIIVIVPFRRVVFGAVSTTMTTTVHTVTNNVSHSETAEHMMI